MGFPSWEPGVPNKEDSAGKKLLSFVRGRAHWSLAPFWEILGVMGFQAGICPQRDLSISSAQLHIHIN